MGWQAAYKPANEQDKVSLMNQITRIVRNSAQARTIYQEIVTADEYEEQDGGYCFDTPTWMDGFMEEEQAEDAKWSPSKKNQSAALYKYEDDECRKCGAGMGTDGCSDCRAEYEDKCTMKTTSSSSSSTSAYYDDPDTQLKRKKGYNSD